MAIQLIPSRLVIFSLIFAGGWAFSRIERGELRVCAGNRTTCSPEALADSILEVPLSLCLMEGARFGAS